MGSPRAYPYATNPVTIPIETDYLLDVIPREISVAAFHPTSIQAQAIAARTFVYIHIRAGSQINNSTEFQVFVPYAFDALNPAVNPNNRSDPCSSTNLNYNQSKVCAGVTPRHYISYGPSDDLPVFSQYFADIKDRTNTGDYLYEIGVDDPVSSHPDILQTICLLLLPIDGIPCKSQVYRLTSIMARDIMSTLNSKIQA